MIKRRTPKPQLRPGVSLKNALELADQSKNFCKKKKTLVIKMKLGPIERENEKM